MNDSHNAIAMRVFLRARASIAIARISYGNSVRPSVCLSVTTRYRFKTSRDRDFEFSLYDSSVSSILWQNFMPLGERVPHKREGEKEHPF